VLDILVRAATVAKDRSERVYLGADYVTIP